MSTIGHQPPSYRLADHVTSRKMADPAVPDMTSSRDVYRPMSRAVDWARNDAQRARVLSSAVDRGSAYEQGPAGRTAGLDVSVSSWPRELGCGRAATEATATSRLFSAATPSPRHHQLLFHEPSNSAPADCSATHRQPPVPLPCVRPVRATRVSERTVHLMSTCRPILTSPSGRRSRTDVACQGLWVGMAETIDIRPVSATALTATVNCNNSERLQLFHTFVKQCHDQFNFILSSVAQRRHRTKFMHNVVSFNLLVVTFALAL